MSPSDLRAELGAPTVPDFEMTLPPGWTRKPVDDATLDDMLARLRDRLMKQHQPQAYAQLRGLVKESFASMKKDGAFAFFSATEEDDSTLWIPASIIASERRGEAGQSLDETLTTLIAIALPALVALIHNLRVVNTAESTVFEAVAPAGLLVEGPWDFETSP